MAALLIAAQASGKPVDVARIGLCDVYGGRESLSDVVVN